MSARQYTFNHPLHEKWDYVYKIMFKSVFTYLCFTLTVASFFQTENLKRSKTVENVM